jgi:hypothetical protein
MTWNIFKQTDKIFRKKTSSLILNLSNNELDTPAERTEKIFDKMDLNNDGVLTKKEFVEGCMKDQFLYQMLTADACQNQ